MSAKKPKKKCAAPQKTGGAAKAQAVVRGPQLADLRPTPDEIEADAELAAWEDASAKCTARLVRGGVDKRGDDAMATMTLEVPSEDNVRTLQLLAHAMWCDYRSTLFVRAQEAGDTDEYGVWKGPFEIRWKLANLKVGTLFAQLDASRLTKMEEV